MADRDPWSELAANQEELGDARPGLRVGIFRPSALERYNHAADSRLQPSLVSPSWRALAWCALAVTLIALASLGRIEIPQRIAGLALVLVGEPEEGDEGLAVIVEAREARRLRAGQELVLDFGGGASRLVTLAIRDQVAAIEAGAALAQQAPGELASAGFVEPVVVAIAHLDRPTEFVAGGRRALAVSVETGRRAALSMLWPRAPGEKG